MAKYILMRGDIVVSNSTDLAKITADYELLLKKYYQDKRPSKCPALLEELKSGK